MEKLTLGQSWHFEKKITISALVTILSTCIIFISLFTTLLNRIDQLEKKTHVIEVEMVNARNVTIAVVRVEERLSAMQNILEELRGEVRSFYRKTSVPDNINFAARINNKEVIDNARYEK